MALNVNRAVEDAFYRYKMPRLIAKVEGKGNGIKTVIPNMSEVALALDRPPTYPTKYFGCELGAQVQMYPEDDRYIVNGAHDAEKLQTLLDGFIAKFVLCKKCSNPETRLRVTSKKEIETKCAACGNRGFLDLTHKLTTFIINNPPTPVDASKGTAFQSKAERRAAKIEKRKEGADGPSDAPPSAASTTAPLSPSRREDSGNGDGEDGEAGDEEWSVDTSAEAVRERASDMSKGAVGLVVSNDMERPLTERLSMFHAFVMAKRDLARFPAKDVLTEAERLDVKDKGVGVLVEALWDTDDLAPRIKQHVALFQRFVVENPKAQKTLLAAVEQLLAKRPALLAKTAPVFKMLYEHDLIDEELFSEWGTQPPSKHLAKDVAETMRAKAKPFLTWLEQADEESEEDEDEDVQVAFDSKAAKGAKLVGTVQPAAAAAAAATAPAAAAAAAAAKPEEDDDVDIDAL